MNSAHPQPGLCHFPPNATVSAQTRPTRSPVHNKHTATKEEIEDNGYPTRNNCGPESILSKVLLPVRMRHSIRRAWLD